MPNTKTFNSRKSNSVSQFQPDWKRDKYLWLIAIATLLLVRPVSFTFEGLQNYAFLHSIVLDCDLDFSNQYLSVLEQTRWYSAQELAYNASTRLPNNRLSIAPAILWAPFLMPALLFESITNVSMPGFTRLELSLVSIATGVYGFLALTMVYQALSKLLNKASARFATTLLWLASPLGYYMHLETDSEHVLTFFLGAVILRITTADARNWKSWAAYGLCAGLLVTMRLGHAVLLAPLAIFEIMRWLRGKENPFISALLPVLSTAITFSIPLLLQIASWKILLGPQWVTQIHVGPNAFDLTKPAYLLEVLMSPHHGLFYWHPLLLMGIAGLFMPRTELIYKAVPLVVFIAAWWWTGSSTQWWAGSSFGHRMYIVALPCLALGAANLYYHYTKLRMPVKVMLVVAALWNLNLIYQFESHQISRRDPVTWKEMLPKT